MERISNLITVNTDLPVGNQTFLFRIPPNTPISSTIFNTRVANSDNYYRWIEDITYRIDTSGIYNIEETQEISYYNPLSNFLTIEPGNYTLSDLNTLFTGFMLPVTLSGANAFKALSKGAPLNSIDLTAAPTIQKMLNWPTLTGPGFVPSLPVDLTVGKDQVVVYADCVSQSAENNRTNLIVIPITSNNGTLGNIISGTLRSYIPLLAGKNSIGSITISLTDALGNPFNINTEVFLNFKVLYALKSQDNNLNKN